MPPRKRGRGRGATKSTPAPKKAPGKRKTIKTEDEEPPPKLKKDESLNSKLKRLIEEEQESSTNKVFKPDAGLASSYPGKKIKIHEDYSCMLNQTNIGKNNNKFYVIQIAEIDSEFILFTKWGRVGEPGQQSMAPFDDVDAGIKSFKKKFTDKTKNAWDKRENFTPIPGKYTMIEINQESDDEDEVDTKASDLKLQKKKIKTKSTLEERTQLLIKLIFSNDMFENQMTSMNLDIRKMPLGKLSKSQILKGLQALLDIEKALNDGANKSVLEDLSSKFYTHVPHNFGRSVPPVINLQSVVDQKKDVMMTLTDIEIAQSLQKETANDDELHPLDINYNKLGCKLERIDNDSEEFKMIQKYATACKNTRKGPLLDVWKVDRLTEAERFMKHDDISYRKLLWHGTNVAVVAAILNSGLRIMPHSGGLVGRGIYFASEHAKSSWYVREHHGQFEGECNIGLMFLTEVALGKMKFIKQCDGSLKAAPKGFDSVVARGRLEPDPKRDIKKIFEGKDVLIPVGTPVNQKDFKDSGFTQSEYLVYKESQARIRYLLKFSFKD